MSLVKCKECGQGVSTKAASCPNCGAKAPKKTSLFTWLVLILIIVGVYGASQDTETTSSRTARNQNAKTNSSALITQTTQKPKWSQTTSTDQMSGKKISFTHSPVTLPTKEMSFPYGDVEAWLGIACDGKNEWAYVGFNSSPNLANTVTEDGYSIVQTRIKWDDTIQNIKMSQDWGASFIHFNNNRSTISKIASSSTALLELKWYGQQPSYFQFSLNGSREALNGIRNICSAN